MPLWSRRQMLGLLAAAFAAASFRTPADLSAEVRIFESSTPHNAFPDECDARLDRLFIAEDLELSIQVTFSRDLSDDESHQVTWQLTGSSGVLAKGDFGGQPNPALVTTTLSN